MREFWNEKDLVKTILGLQVRVEVQEEIPGDLGADDEDEYGHLRDKCYHDRG